MKRFKSNPTLSSLVSEATRSGFLFVLYINFMCGFIFDGIITFMNTNKELIELLEKDGYLNKGTVIGAFKCIDRKDFVSDEFKSKAYENEALPIGNNQTISQPLVVAFMLELLDLQSGDKVLEIGTGSGWKTTLMAHILTNGKEDTNETSINISYSIVSIERIKDLYEIAKKNISKYNQDIQSSVKLILGDASVGYKESAPYDKIIAAAGADEVPQAWLEQLKIGGRIVAPIKDSIVMIEKKSKDKYETKEYFGFSFVPLIKD
jgi:protein-L-isoaspartate(D-aspartate) O-methyltransferase